MKTQVELLTETENILLKLLAQYQSGQYVLLTRAITNVRILKALGNPTTGAVDLGWECGICKSSNMESEQIGLHTSNSRSTNNNASCGNTGRIVVCAGR